MKKKKKSVQILLLYSCGKGSGVGVGGRGGVAGCKASALQLEMQRPFVFFCETFWFEVT